MIPSDYDVLVEALARKDWSVWPALTDWLLEFGDGNQYAWAMWAWKTGRCPFWYRDTHYPFPCKTFKRCAWYMNHPYPEDPDDLPEVFEHKRADGSTNWWKCATPLQAWLEFFEEARHTPLYYSIKVSTHVSTR